MSPDPIDWGPDEAYWPQMVDTLLDFGLARSTAMHLVGMPHVSKAMVDRWTAYCTLRGPDSPHGQPAFLITRLLRNDVPPPSWGALRRLAAKTGKSLSPPPPADAISAHDRRRLPS